MKLRIEIYYTFTRIDNKFHKLTNFNANLLLENTKAKSIIYTVSSLMYNSYQLYNTKQWSSLQTFTILK